MVWVLFGLPMVHPHSMLVLTISGIGTAIEFVYIALFLFYSDKKKRLKVLFVVLIELIFIVVVTILVLTLLHTTKQRSLVVGIICILFNVMMNAAPLSVMKLVITTKSVEYMPFFLSLASFGNSVAWFTYAFLPFDEFIAVYNARDAHKSPVVIVSHDMIVIRDVHVLTEICCMSDESMIPNGLGTMFSMAQLLLYGYYYRSTQRIKAARQQQLKGELDMSEVVVSGDSRKIAGTTTLHNGHHGGSEIYGT
ncbi:hypothetical protein Q3G72_012254 [Acer saccharum]|nr:hypothetical protein Q3G72_012254 [Acer saccharum]